MTASDLAGGKSFEKAHNVLKDVVTGISEIINVPGHVGVEISAAKGVLVVIAASERSLRLSESKLAMTTIRALASPDTHIIYGTTYDESLGDALRVTVTTVI